MSVEIDPLELGFRRPFTVEVSQVLKIKNPNSTPVAFKVKTTAPKQYCVRPNSGRIEPDRDVDVTVLLQAMKQDPPLDAKCRDKFLVQSVPVTGDKEFVSVQEIWDSVEKSAIQEKKIRVSFLPADGSKPAQPEAATPVRRAVTNGVESTPEPSTSYSSPQPEETVVSTSPAAGESSPEIKHEAKEIKHEAKEIKHEAKEIKHEAKEIKHEAKEKLEESPLAVAGSTTADVKDTAAQSVEALKARLAKAEAKLANLKNESGLRQRKPASGAAGETSTAAPQLQEAVRHEPEGVPVRIVAILCLISFLLGYFFF